MFVVTWSLRDRHVVIWTNQRPADVQQLSPCVSVKFIHVESRERKMSMPPDLMTGCRDAKTEPIAAQLAILPLHFYAVIHWARRLGLHVPIVGCWADYRRCRNEGNPRQDFWVHVDLDPCNHCLHHQLIAHILTQLQACPFCRLL